MLLYCFGSILKHILFEMKKSSNPFYLTLIRIFKYQNKYSEVQSHFVLLVLSGTIS